MHSDAPLAPSVSLVVLTLDAERHMPALLDALSRIAGRARRVVFVDSTSSDATPALAAAAGHPVHRIDRATFGHGRTRNVGLRLCADSDVVVYLTQDAVPQGDDWLERLLRPFDDPRVSVVYGRQLPRPQAGWLERYAREFNYPARPDRTDARDIASRGIKAVFCSNSFAAYRRDALEAVGGFPEHLPMGEDMAATLRLLQRGGARVYEPAATAVHSHAYTPWEEFKRYFDIGALLAIDAELSRARPAASGEGARYLMGELSTGLRHGGPLSVVTVGVRAVAKYAGFALGLRHAALPASLRRRLSMHAHFWSHG